MRITNKKILALAAGILVLSLLFVSSRSITSSYRASITDSLAPAMGSVRSTLSFPERILPFSSLRDVNKQLRSRIAVLEQKLGQMKIVAEENKRLKELLDFKKTLPYSAVPAQIIGRDPSNWSNSVIINKGSVHGVKPNKPVISPKGLVGRVVETGKYSSRILLITDPNSKVGVVIERNRQGGILTGRPDGKCKMIYIAIDSDARAGDRVITSGLGSIFPKDIVVGEIVSIGKEPGRLYKFAIVRAAQDLSKLEEVLCVK